MPSEKIPITVVVEHDSAQGRDRMLFARGKAVDLAGRTVDVVASTIRIDRDGEIILPSAFAATLPKFLATNAPLLAAHTHRSDDGTPTQIGWVMGGGIESDRIVMQIRFAQGEPAEGWWRLASDPGGKGIAVSIGFRPLRYVTGSAKDLAAQMPEIRPSVRAAGLADGDNLLVYTEIELYELSCVPVPSNREALQQLAMKAFGAGADADKALDELAEKIGVRIGSSILPAAIGKAFAEAELKAFLRGAVDEGLKDLRADLSEWKTEIISSLPDPLGSRARGCGPASNADEDPTADGEDPGAGSKSTLLRQGCGGLALHSVFRDGGAAGVVKDLVAYLKTRNKRP